MCAHRGANSRSLTELRPRFHLAILYCPGSTPSCIIGVVSLLCVRVTAAPERIVWHLMFPEGVMSKVGYASLDTPRYVERLAAAGG